MVTVTRWIDMIQVNGNWEVPDEDEAWMAVPVPQEEERCTYKGSRRVCQAYVRSQERRLRYDVEW